ncbi:hypothetical protein PRIPAC_72517 [Pristionchus pacificus]|uniref:Uncharacterized protein n=1 Tax=Pristionchus pacificus TaxID=54126 RepID=A0A2A6C543_PRIPA|nr:hypothetical protein PRIPAC_72517 [Pristionchus pacificus]|eukprot:PDM73295.1 hypothetical protein PRIPAC_40651 [Pristionchus pacificus]
MKGLTLVVALLFIACADAHYCFKREKGDKLLHGSANEKVLVGQKGNSTIYCCKDAYCNGSTTSSLLLLLLPIGLAAARQL